MSNSVEILGNNLVEVSIQASPVVEVNVEPPAAVEIEVLPGGVYYGGVLSLEYQLILNRLVSQPSVYKELLYTGDNLTGINVWNNSNKDTQLMSITFTFTGDNLTQKVLTDSVSGKVLTVTYGYTGSNLTSINEVFS